MYSKIKGKAIWLNWGDRKTLAYTFMSSLEPGTRTSGLQTTGSFEIKTM